MLMTLSRSARTSGFVLALVVGTSLSGVAIASGGGDHGPKYSVDANHNGTADWMDSESDAFVLKGISWHAFNLAVYIGLVVWAGRAALGDAVRQRALGIKADISEAAKLLDDARGRHDEVVSRLAKFESELAGIEERAKVQAAAEEAAIEARAVAASKRIAETATRQISDEAARARNEIRREAVEVAVKLAEGILRDQVQAGDHRRLAREFLDTVDGEGVNGA